MVLRSDARRRAPAAESSSSSRAASAHGRLIEGGAGPFYVALNEPTLYLLAAIFFTAVPWLLYAIRDTGTAVRLFVSLGIAMESGTLVHIWLERVRGAGGLVSWGTHAAVTAALAAGLLLLML